MNLRTPFSAAILTPLRTYAPEGLARGYNTLEQPNVDASQVENAVLTRAVVAEVATVEPNTNQPA